ncbi:hypothetical protein BG74_01135 [Sodalis-like endosymbiont of Proechinophthirus fluctus]|nr:hypothetical protein BG74_01135 [Sodalis-like endosymbiont of Proechinophthirus fluctus]
MENFIDKDDIFAIEEIVKIRFEKMMKELKEQKVKGDEINLIELFKRMREEEEKLNSKEEKNYRILQDEMINSTKKNRKFDSFSGSFRKSIESFGGGRGESLKNEISISGSAAGRTLATGRERDGSTEDDLPGISSVEIGSKSKTSATITVSDSGKKKKKISLFLTFSRRIRLKK